MPLTRAEKEQIDRDFEREQERKAAEEQQRQKREAAAFVEKEQRTAHLRLIAGWMANNNRMAFEPGEREQYNATQNKLWLAQANGESFLASKCSDALAEILDSVFMRMAAAAIEASKGLNVSDAQAKEFLSAGEWVMSLCREGWTEEEAEELLATAI